MALGYFNSVSDALEIKMRTHSINEKITYAAELQSVLRQLLAEVGIQIGILITGTSCYSRHLPRGWN